MLLDETREVSPLSAVGGTHSNMLTPPPVQVNSSFNSEEPGRYLLILEELKEMQKTLSLHYGCRQEGGKFHRLATNINRAFFAFYVVAVLLFLPLICMEWSS